MKKRICRILCLVLLLPMAGAVRAQSMPTPEAQIELLLSFQQIWLQTEFSEYQPNFYTVTDLNHNGRLEIFTAITQGTGIFTSGKLFEVSEDFGFLNWILPEGDGYLPEVIVSRTDCYESDGIYRYAFEDSSRNGAAEELVARQWLTVNAGQIELETIASRHLLSDWQTETVTVEYEAFGNPVTEEEYESAFEQAGAGMNRTRVSLDWRTASRFSTAQDLMECYQVFTGQRRLLRDEETVGYVVVEGMPEEVLCRLFVAEDYSIYIPEDTYQYASENGRDTWVSIYNPDVRFRIVKLADMDFNAAQQWVMRKNLDYALQEDADGILMGSDRSRMNILQAIIRTEGSDAYAILMYFPYEAWEGFGCRMMDMAATFEAG